MKVARQGSHNKQRQQQVLQQQLIRSAREHLQAKRYQRACEVYQSLIENMQNTVIACTNNQLVNCFSRYCMEYGLCLRKSQPGYNLNHYFQHIKKLLNQSHLQPNYIKQLLMPLSDVLFASLKDVENWMAILFAVDEKKQQTLH